MRESKHKANGRKRITFFDKAPAFRTYVGWPSLQTKKDVFGLCLTSRKEITRTYSRLSKRDGLVFEEDEATGEQVVVDLAEIRLVKTGQFYNISQTQRSLTLFVTTLWNPTVSTKKDKVSVSAFQHGL